MEFLSADAHERARRVRLVVFDVDGVLTDGRLWYGPDGEALKAFHAFDGHGVKMLQQAGLRAAILSGRDMPAVVERARELAIAHVLQGVENKRRAFDALLRRLKLGRAAAAYMGDDVVDLGVLAHCGLACAPHEAPEAVRSVAHCIPSAPAGGGAAREVCEFILQAQGKLARLLRRYRR
jgi:3-deoxy-D-manno-octulosonate 8-phosphate phosphatase (KDO 8-P phosphatase)